MSNTGTLDQGAGQPKLGDTLIERVGRWKNLAQYQASGNAAYHWYPPDFDGLASLLRDVETALDGKAA